MAEETKSISIQPSHQVDLLVTSAELKKQDPVWLVLVKAGTEQHQGNAHGVPNVSVHYYCESHLAPRPGSYIRIYIEGQKAGIPLLEEE